MMVIWSLGPTMVFFFFATLFFSPEGEEKRGEEIRDVIRLPCPGALELPNED